MTNLNISGRNKMADNKETEEFEALLHGAVSDLSSEKESLEVIANKNKAYDDAIRDIDIEDRQENLNIKRQCKEKREYLSKWLLCVAIGWLIFSGRVILLIGRGELCFGEISVATFIVGSLAEVFGLWKIALQYFFSDK